METINLPLDEKRYIVVNKGKILLVTYNRPSAERLSRLVAKNNYPKDYELVVKSRKSM